MLNTKWGSPQLHFFRLWYSTDGNSWPSALSANALPLNRLTIQFWNSLQFLNPESLIPVQKLSPQLSRGSYYSYKKIRSEDNTAWFYHATTYQPSQYIVCTIRDHPGKLQPNRCVYEKVHMQCRNHLREKMTTIIYNYSVGTVIHISSLWIEFFIMNTFLQLQKISCLINSFIGWADNMGSRVYQCMYKCIYSLHL